MAFQLGNVIVNFLGDKTVLDKTVKQTEKDITGMHKRTEGATRSWASRVGGFFQDAFSFATGGIIQRAVEGVTSAVGSSIIGMNASLETSTLQFETLMGSAELAESHVKSLFEFGARTPFETGPIIEASRLMETFGGSALNNMENLTLLGDAAAATGQKINEVGFWVSRAYDAMMSGRPWGESAMRLQEMGIMSGAARNELEEMSKSGASGAEVWARFQQVLGKYSGAMERQANTWEGITSTLVEGVQMIVADAFQPLFQGLKEGIKWLNAFLESGEVQSWVQAFAGGLRRVIVEVVAWGRVILAMARPAFEWGANIAGSFAEGIGSAIGVVVQMLRTIGSVIASWLRPGSPPKLLPDLTKWGAGAATAYMDGWREADFGALEELGGAIEDFLGGLVDTGKLNKGGIVPIIMGSREAIGAAINEMREFGKVSEDSIQRVVDAAGPAGSQVEGLVRAYFDLAEATQEVADAQDELNRITEEYDQKLAPVNAELAALRNRKDEIKAMQRIKELQKDLASGKLDEYEQELARLEIAEISAEQRQRAIENERDAAVNAAEERLKAAEKEQEAAQQRYDAQQRLLEATNKNNDLLAQQMDALKGAAGAAGAAAGAMAGLPGAIEGQMAPVTETMGKVKNVLDGVQERAAGIQTWLTNAGTTANTIFGPAMAYLTDVVGARLLPAFERFRSWLMAEGPGAMETASAFIAGTLLPVLGSIADVFLNQIVPGALDLAIWIGERLPVAFAFLQENILPILAAVGAGFLAFVYSVLIPAFQAWALGAILAAAPTIAAMLPVITVVGLVAAAAALLALAWQQNWGNIQGIAAAAWGFLGPLLAQLQTWLATNIPIALQMLANFWTGTLLPAIMAVWGWITGTLIPMLSELWTWVSSTLTTALQMLANFWTGTLLPAIMAVWGFINGTLIPIFQSLYGVYIAALLVAVELARVAFELFRVVLMTVWSAISTHLNPILDAMKVAWGLVQGAVQKAWEAFSTKMQPILGEIKTGLDLATTAANGVADVMKGALAGGITLAKDALGKLQSGLSGIIEFLNKVRDAAKRAGDAIAGIKPGAVMTPGSPTPFEMGLRGIHDAMRDLNDHPIPRLQAGLSDAGAGALAVVGGTSIGTQNINMYWQGERRGEPDIGRDLRIARMLGVFDPGG